MLADSDSRAVLSEHAGDISAQINRPLSWLLPLRLASRSIFADGAPSHEGFRGNSRRLTKAEIIHLVNRHVVSLADDCALGSPRVSYRPQ